MDKYEQLALALQKRLKIEATYTKEGNEPEKRIFFALVLGEKHGSKNVLVDQVGGVSSQGLKSNETNWRCIKLEYLSNLVLTDEVDTRPAPDVEPPTCIDKVEFSILPKAPPN